MSQPMFPFLFTRQLLFGTRLVIMTDTTGALSKTTV